MNTSDQARQIAGGLSAEERRDLQTILDGKFHDDEDNNTVTTYTALWNKHLITRSYEKTRVTNLGCEVLQVFFEHENEPLPAAATREPAEAGERTLKIGQLVRYVGQSVNEIPYGTFGIVAEYERNLDWYGVQFFDIEGIRSVKNIVLQTVKPKNVNRVERELASLRRQLEQSEREKAGLREALENIRDFDVAANSENGLETTENQATAMWQMRYIARKATSGAEGGGQ